jgi:hypothetical protein
MSNGFVRRVVTGFDEAGNSTIVEDGKSPHIKSVPERPGYYSTNIWRSGAAPVSVAEPDQISGHIGVSPPANGTVLRVIEFPPEPQDLEEKTRQIKATFGEIFQDADQSHSQELHPGMHQTDTVDYAIVLEGEIVAMMEKAETILKTGDILVQRGTNHAWSNRSEHPCKVAFILIDGQRN